MESPYGKTDDREEFSDRSDFLSDHGNQGEESPDEKELSSEHDTDSDYDHRADVDSENDNEHEHEQRKQRDQTANCFPSPNDRFPKHLSEMTQSLEYGAKREEAHRRHFGQRNRTPKALLEALNEAISTCFLCLDDNLFFGIAVLA